MVKSIFNQLTRMTTQSKTLRFKLVPVGSTEKHIEEIMKNDKERAKQYPIVKRLIDDGYRKIINDSFKDIKVDFNKLYKSYLESNELEIAENERKIVKELDNAIKKHDDFKKLTGEKFSEVLEKNNLSEEEKNAITKFNRFTTYFLGFHQNRENVFSTDEIATSIYYRIVKENFNIFVSNKRVIDELEENSIFEKVADSFSKYNKMGRNTDIKKEYFSIENYTNLLTQSGIDKFNELLGGFVVDGVKIKGLNEEINEFYQKRGQKSKSLLFLKKQILSDVDRTPLFDSIENDEDLLNRIKEYFNQFKEKNVIGQLEELIKSLKESQGDKIYISNAGVNLLSSKEYHDYSYILNETKIGMLNNKISVGSNKKVSKKDELNIINKLGIKEEDTEEKIKSILISDILENSRIDIIDLYEKFFKEYIEKINNSLEEFDCIIGKLNLENIKNSEVISTFKNFLDSVQDLYRYLKHLSAKDQKEINTDFYLDFNNNINLLESNNRMLNIVRNYITKVPYNKEKIKLNFDTPTLGNGWSYSKENDNKCIILRKDNDYYLGILNSNIDFSSIKKGTSNYQKMYYYLKAGANKDFPKCIFTKDVKSHFEKNETDYILNGKNFIKDFIVTKELFDTFNKTYNGYKKFQKDYLKQNPDKEDEFKKSLITAIDGCKEFTKAYKGYAPFDFKDLKNSDEYTDISEFYNQVDKICYKVYFEDKDAKEIDQLVETGKLLLFKIYNKDFAVGKTGKDNLHTLYFKGLFSDENLRYGDIRLSGNAELFFREKSIKEPFIHIKGEVLVNKMYTDQNGEIKSIPGEILKEINLKIKDNSLDKLSEEAKKYYDIATKKVATHDIIKDRRYTKNHFEFHFAIKLNAKADDKNINLKIQNLIKENNFNIIGIDRGERNLLYVSVINSQGQIIEQKSLNIINNVDYHEKLSVRESERDEARKSWNTIEKIKDLKEGYLSAAVHEISKMVIKYNALVVLEDLNIGFKRGRFKFEKQVYQKFENMLINKLSYLAFKDDDPSMPGGVLNGYQLTKEENVLSRSNRNGIVFFVPAGYTSKIDPTTGFTNIIKFGKYKTISELSKLVNLFESIKYNKKSDTFIFRIDYSKLSENKQEKSKIWDIHTIGNRYEITKNNLGRTVIKNINLTEELKNILQLNDIEVVDEKDYKNIVLNDSNLLKKFISVYKLAVQMRNTNNELGEDSIISPIIKNGKNYNTNNKLEGLPIDADGNGAYNIALKGLCIIDRYKKSNDEKINTRLSNNDWFSYIENEVNW